MEDRKLRAASVIFLVAVLLMSLVVIASPKVLATHGDVEVWPAYYEDEVVYVMMGPSGNNLNQVNFGCWGLGPDISGASKPKGLPEFYALFVPGATQMYCPNGSNPHDMIVTAVPGDPGYNPKIQLTACGPDENFDESKMPYTSASAVEAGIVADELVCGPFGVLLSPVVLGPP